MGRKLVPPSNREHTPTMKIEIEDADIDRIAEAVKAKLGGKAPAPAAASGETAPKGKGKTAAPLPEKEEQSAEAIQKRRGELLAKVKDLGEKTSREQAKAIIQNYAPTLGEVKPGDFDALDQDLDTALADAAKPKAAEDDY